MVMFYEIGTETPVLYLDTLKVSTIEQTAENVSARGGKGNPESIKISSFAKFLKRKLELSFKDLIYLNNILFFLIQLFL